LCEYGWAWPRETPRQSSACRSQRQAPIPSRPSESPPLLRTGRGPKWGPRPRGGGWRDAHSSGSRLDSRPSLKGHTAGSHSDCRPPCSVGRRRREGEPRRALLLGFSVRSGEWAYALVASPVCTSNRHRHRSPAPSRGHFARECRDLSDVRSRCAGRGIESQFWWNRHADCRKAGGRSLWNGLPGGRPHARTRRSSLNDRVRKPWGGPAKVARSAPAEKVRPAPRTTTTFTRSRPLNQRAAANELTKRRGGERVEPVRPGSG